MPKTSLPKIAEIKKRFSDFRFKEHEVFHWSPKDNCVYYNPKELESAEGIYQLLHEVGHAVLGHTNYTSGIALVKIEAEAWAKANEIAAHYELEIGSEQIERCLDSYRDWLYLRSRCPSCDTTAVEIESNRYHCFNCLQKWSVPTDQRTRQYRLKLAGNVR